MVDYLAEAFKALDDVEDVMPCLHEEMFTVDSDGLSELADFEVESEKSEDKKRVIDPEAKNEEELKSSYVGKVIIDCNQCHSKIYKDKEDIVIDGEDANKEEECPYCFATEGFKVVGEVAPYTETKVDVEVEDKDTMTEGVRRRHRAAKKMGKKVVEEFNGSYHTLTIIDDLVDRAKLIYKEQSDPDISEAVLQAIDDGLIYYDDILELAGAYGVIDYGELVDKFVDDLAYDMGTQLESILAEEDDELKEAVKGRVNERKERANGRNTRRKGKLAESDRIRRRGVGGIKTTTIRPIFNLNRPTSWTMTKDRKYDITFDKDGNFIAETRHGKTYYVYGNIEDSSSSSLTDDEGRIVDAVREQISRNDESLTEAPIYDLTPQFDTRRSFYNKARIDTGSDNSENKLYSYNTLVAEMIGGKPVVYNVQSGTTLRHVKEWLRQNGFKAETKSQIIRDYGVDDIVTESLEEVEVKTDTDKIKISSETITKDDEMAIPVTDDTKDAIIAGGEEEGTEDEIVADDEEEDTVDDIEEFDEESFDELSESYLKKVYSNVDGYKTSNVSFNKSGLCVEGIISFKSGNKKNTQFIFESRDNGKRFVGENKQITRGKKAFTVKGSIKDGKFITESFNYRYSAINPQTGKSENLYETLKRGK